MEMAGHEQVIAEAKEWLDSFLDAVRGGAATIEDGLVQLEDHPDFLYAFQGMILSPKAAAVEVFRDVFKDLESEPLEVHERFVTALGPDIAHIAASGTFFRNFADGTTTDPMKWALSVVLVRTEDGWKGRLFHNSEAEITE
jgi:hypothetical protein